MLMTSPAADPRLSGFDQFVLHVMKDWQVPGVAVGVVENNHLIHASGYGLRDVRRRLAFTVNTLTCIGSCAHSFAATAVGILVDEGKLEWDRPIWDYLPLDKEDHQEADATFTARNLLSDSPGSEWDDYGARTSSEIRARAKLLDRLTYLARSEDLRRSAEYGDLMLVVAGLLIERVTGRPWAEFLNERFFDPLGMDTSQFVAHGQTRGEEIAGGYKKVGRRTMPWYRGRPDTQEALKWGNYTGAAGTILSNLIDMCRWLALQISRGMIGGVKVISEDSLSEIHRGPRRNTTLTTGEDLCEAAYAMGWTVRPYRGRPLVTHQSGVYGFSTHTSFLPDMSLGLVVLANMHRSPLLRVIPYDAYDRLLDLEPIAWNSRAKREERKRAALARARSRRRRSVTLS